MTCSLRQVPLVLSLPKGQGERDVSVLINTHKLHTLEFALLLYLHDREAADSRRFQGCGVLIAFCEFFDTFGDIIV